MIPGLFATLLLDTGGLFAFARRDPRARVVATRSAGLGAQVAVSWMTLAEIQPTRDAAAVRWALSTIRLVPVTEDDCRRAARLMSDAGAGGRTVDALIAVAALRLPKPVVVLTSDPKDMGVLLAGETGIAVVAV